MKLTIRPLQRGKDPFVVEAQPSETISDLKLRISEHGFPVEGQNLLNTGKALQDDKTIGSCGIKEASTLVLMIKAPSAAVTPAPSKSNSPRIPPATLSTPPSVPGPAKAASSSHLTVPTPAYAPTHVTPPPAPPVAASSSPKPISETPQGPTSNGAGNVGPSQSNINSITAMGFTQDQAVRALHYSNNNVDQAIDFLVDDPHNLGADLPPRVAQPPNSSLENGPRFASGTAPQPNGPSQDLMRMAQQQQQQQEPPDISSMSLNALGGPGGSGGGGGGGSGGATAEVSPEQIQEIRRLVASNPILMGPLLEQFKQEDPELYNRVGGESALTNPEKLLQVLSEGGDDSGPSGPSAPTSFQPVALPPAPARLQAAAPVPAPMPQRGPEPGTETTISVTEEEHEQIQNIIGMGFEQQAVLQAFLACDRDAQRAVDFLLAGAFE